MANVIPREGLNLVQKRNSARFLLVGACMLFAAAIVAILAILPAYVSVRVARAAVDAATNEAAAMAAGDQDAAVRTQRLIASLSPVVSATSSPSEALTIALAQKPQGISITTISYTGGSKETLLLTGTSQRRESLNTFRNALEATMRFSGVAVPVAALVGTQEGRFTITLSGI